MRARLQSAFDRFIEVRDKSDADVAMMARGLGIDIAVDLNGYTEFSRTNIFALRAAPIQINYLGYPGTMGAEYMDYLIADRTVVPEAQQSHYAERVVYLPNSYLPHDSTRTISATVFTREELGLPKEGFVFCCFNNNYKITPSTFSSWMRILGRTDNSVLWLAQNDPVTARNLQREAVRRGVKAERLVFSSRTASLSEHLARLRIADLFLDTLPYNAHASATDALWAGLPLVTRRGEAFAGRVAASLLTAIGLPELITSTEEQYEDLAVQLATSPQLLVAIKDKLHRNRSTAPLFDTRLFTKHLETAYVKILERHRAGLPPDHIYVNP
jgi:predicted O-linked N-acetylglucosamine transferase (SPINDLY family)